MEMACIVLIKGIERIERNHCKRMQQQVTTGWILFQRAFFELFCLNSVEVPQEEDPKKEEDAKQVAVEEPTKPFNSLELLAITFEDDTPVEEIVVEDTASHHSSEYAIPPPIILQAAAMEKKNLRKPRPSLRRVLATIKARLA